jgi:hypothetical protein
MFACTSAAHGRRAPGLKSQLLRDELDTQQCCRRAWTSRPRNELELHLELARELHGSRRQVHIQEELVEIRKMLFSSRAPGRPRASA